MATEIQAVSVVIVNYNAGAVLIDCVHSALAQAEQVIVVDNDSYDNSMELLANQFTSEPRLVTLCERKNRGFAAGCNLGVALSKQPLLLFLNPDCMAKIVLRLLFT